MFQITRRQILENLLASAVLLIAQALVVGQETPPAPLKVLFIGNRYTSVNDLPALVAELAEAAGGRKIEMAWQHSRRKRVEDLPFAAAIEREGDVPFCAFGAEPGHYVTSPLATAVRRTQQVGCADPAALRPPDGPAGECLA